MRKVFVSISKDNKLRASGVICVEDIGGDKPTTNDIKEQLETNKALYKIIAEEGTIIYKGVMAIMALALRGYKVTFKEYINEK